MLNTNNCVHSKIAIHDLNNDDIPDLLRGNASGGVELFFGESFNISNNIYHTTDVHVFPNPNNGEFNIKIPNNMQSIIQLYNNIGELLFEKKTLSNYELVEINNLKAGLYIVRIQLNDQLIVKKIIIQK